MRQADLVLSALVDPHGGATPPIRRFVVRVATLARIFGVSSDTIYRRVRDDRFPRPIALTERGALGWISDEVVGWDDARASRAPRPVDAAPPACADRVLRAPRVAAITALSPPTIAATIRAGRFPPPFALCGAARGWSLLEIEAWIGAKMEQRTPSRFHLAARLAPLQVTPWPLRLNDVEAITRLSGSQIYSLIAAGDFPAGVVSRRPGDGKRVVEWPAEAVAVWIRARRTGGKVAR
jgi:predicted DNA-binding transcriptional regulator AlpA